MSRLLYGTPKLGQTAQVPRLADWVWRYRPTFAVVPAAVNGYDPVNKKYGSSITGGPAAFATTRYGKVFKFTGSGGGVSLTRNTPMSGLYFSWVFLGSMRTAGPSTLGRAFNGATRDIYPNISNRMEFTVAFSGGQQAMTINYPWDGVTRCLALSHSATAANILPTVYLNGVKDGSVSLSGGSSGTYSASPAVSVNIGNVGLNTRSYDGDIAYQVFFDTLLPESVLKSITINPWLMFSP